MMAAFIEASLNELPSELLSQILIFADYGSRFKLASSNKSMQRLVLADCLSAWKSIDFYLYATTEQQKCLTDAQLSSLLVRVNARSVTTHFSVKGCSSLCGYGMFPLSYSQVLKSVNLCTQCPIKNICTTLDNVLSVLKTCSCLQTTELPYISNSDLANSIVALDIAKKRNVFVQSLFRQRCMGLCIANVPHCNQCHEMVPCLHHETNNDSAVTCLFCNKVYCGVGSTGCNTYRSCTRCGSICCESCNSLTLSDYTGGLICPLCSPTCDRCQETFCVDDETEPLTCDFCEKVQCTDCQEEDVRSIHHCLMCHMSSCHSCEIQYPLLHENCSWI